MTNFFRTEISQQPLDDIKFNTEINVFFKGLIQLTLVSPDFSFIDIIRSTELKRLE